MAMIRWLGESDVFSQLDGMRRDMDRLMSAFRPWSGSAYRSGVYPQMNVYDDGESFIVRAEVPGVDPKDIDLTVTGDTLTIQGERRLEEVPEGASYHRRERSSGQFRRSLTLPDQVDSSKVAATCKHGILQILLPRAEQARQRKVKIQS
jgi:HSP20 family protein